MRASAVVFSWRMALPDGHWVDLVRPIVAGRRVILGGGPLAAFTRQVALVRQLGATSCLVIAGGLGTGQLPSRTDCEWVIVDVAAPDLMSETRNWEAVLADPPHVLVQTLDRFDPDHSALVWLPPFQAVPAVGGRAVDGARRPEWVALEDKTRIDDSWNRWGVPHPEHNVVSVDDTAGLSSARATLDGACGTVWSGDASEGFNGGAVFVRWVRTDVDAADAHAFFVSHCRRIRIARFVEGVPCSIHGMVFEDYVAVFRPVELIVLRSPTEGLVYAGTATYWDPPHADREMMRAIARRVGTALREEVGFRGAFTIDGILSADGFVATELNPRFGAGLGPIAGDGSDVLLVHRALVAGAVLDYRPDAFEAHVIARADSRRAGAAYLPVPRAFAHTETHELTECEGWQLAEDDDKVDARLELGPRASGPGGFARVQPEPSRTPNGPPIAGRAVDMLTFANRRFDLGMGELHSSIDVRDDRTSTVEPC